VKNLLRAIREPLRSVSDSAAIAGLTTLRLSAIAAILFAIKLMLSGCGLVGVGIIGFATFLGWQSLKSKKFLGRASAFLTIAGISALIAAWLSTSIDPAQAQFFYQGETFLRTTLLSNNTTLGGAGNIATNVISIIFNVLRAVYLLYLAVSAIGVINAVRQDEDWQTAARTPMLVFVVVTFTDVLTSFIIGPNPTPA
jgi:hypothetical protein